VTLLKIGVFRDLALAHELGIEASQDFQQRRFARAVGTDHADVRAVKEGEIDILKDGLLLVLLGNVDEREYVFAGHS
jgi:hypothetical protein